MEKQMHKIAGNIKFSALVILGWLSFFGSFIWDDIAIILILQTIARVLPKFFNFNRYKYIWNLLLNVDYYQSTFIIMDV